MLEMQEFTDLLRKNPQGIKRIEDIFNLVPFHEIEWRDYFAVLAKGIQNPTVVPIPAWLWDLRLIICLADGLKAEDISAGFNVPVAMVEAIRAGNVVGKDRYHELDCYEETKERFKEWYINRVLSDGVLLLQHADLVKHILNTESKTAETIHEIYALAESLSMFAQKVDYTCHD